MAPMKPVLTRIGRLLRKTGPVGTDGPDTTRPYRVHLDVPVLSGSFWRPGVTVQRWADVALTPAQAATLTGGADRDRILAVRAFPLDRIITGWAFASLLLLLSAFIPVVGYAAAAAIWATGTGVVALVLGRHWRFLGRARHRINRVLIPASVGGAAHRVSLHDENWSRLYRIETALTVLQAHAGADYDDQARAAVRHVLNPPAPARREPDLTPKGTSPKAKYRAAMHEALSGLLRPAGPAPVDPVAALEAEAARLRAR